MHGRDRHLAAAAAALFARSRGVANLANSGSQGPAGSTDAATVGPRATMRGAFMYVGRFADHTSMHAVAQLFRADSYTRRLFWLLLACLTTAAGCLHAYLTVRQFNTTPVNTLILNQGVDTLFPDVTLCNLRPMPASLTYYNTVARARAEAAMAELLARLKPIYARQYARRPGKLADLFSAHDYFNWYQLLQHYWASRPTAQLGYNLSLGLVGCVYKKTRCKPTDFQLVQSSHYWNCWSFRPTDRSVQGNGPGDGLDVILYTSSMPRDLVSPTGDYHVIYPPRVNRTVLEQLGTVFGKAGMQTSNGVRVLLHEPDTYPHLYWEGVDVGNGWSSDIRFRMTRNLYVNRTRHRCVQDYGRVPYWVSEPDTRRIFKRRLQDCVVQLWQAHLRAGCACESTFLPTGNRSNLCHRLEDRPAGQRNYSAQKAAQLQRFNRVEGAVRTGLSDRFVAECSRLQACQRDEYRYASAGVPWPSPSDLEAFVHTFINVAGKRSRARQSHGLGLLDLILAESGDSQWNISLRFVRENFIKVHVYAEESKGTLMRESPSYTLVEVLSELGGIFGLWAGMSLVTFVELFDFSVTFVVKCIQGVTLQLRNKERLQQQRRRQNGSRGGGGGTRRQATSATSAFVAAAAAAAAAATAAASASTSGATKNVNHQNHQAVDIAMMDADVDEDESDGLGDESQLMQIFCFNRNSVGDDEFSQQPERCPLAEF